MSLQQVHEGFMMGTSILSAVSSATIIAAYAGIPAVRKRKYFEALFYIGISNFITSVGSSFGFVRDGSAECWVQGIITNVFSLASIAWTVVISIMLNHAIVEAKMMEITPLIHAVCWSLPMVVTLLPLVELEFSSVGGRYWCFYESEREGYPYGRLVMWRWVGFYFWALFGVVLIMVLFAIMYRRKARMIKETTFIVKLVEKLKYYPFIIVICWLPGSIYDTTPLYLRHINIVTTSLSCLHGTLLAAVFWGQNYNLLRSLKESGKEIDLTATLAKVPVQTQSPMFNEYNDDADDNARDSSMSADGDLKSTHHMWNMGDVSDSERTQSF